MFRRFTALTFIVAMVSMLALKHPALAFCTCEHKVIGISECTDITTQSVSLTSECCQKCESKTSQKSDTCTISITFDSGDFLSLNSPELPSPASLQLPPVAHTILLEKSFTTSFTPNQKALQNAPPVWQPLQAITGIFLI